VIEKEKKGLPAEREKREQREAYVLGLSSAGERANPAFISRIRALKYESL